MLGTILIVILILFLLGALPTWPHSRSWGYGPERRAGLGCGRSARLDAHGTPSFLIASAERVRESDHDRDRGGSGAAVDEVVTLLATAARLSTRARCSRWTEQ